MRLRGVFDHPQAMPLSDVEDGIKVGGLTIEVNRQQRAGARRDRRLDEAWVDIMGGRVRLYRDRCCAHAGYSEPGGDIGV